MRLVTFQAEDGHSGAGALIAGDSTVVDLQRSFEARWGKPSPHLASVLAIAEGGDEAMAVAADTIAQASQTLPASAVKLLAPIPRPPQMRDFLCFEKHLLQAFGQARLVRSQQFPDPQAALDEMERDGVLRVPQTWYERPIFYHPNRLNVIGGDEDVMWPEYSERMDF